MDTDVPIAIAISRRAGRRTGSSGLQHLAHLLAAKMTPSARELDPDRSRHASSPAPAQANRRGRGAKLSGFRRDDFAFTSIGDAGALRRASCPVHAHLDRPAGRRAVRTGGSTLPRNGREILEQEYWRISLHDQPLRGLARSSLAMTMKLGEKFGLRQLLIERQDRSAARQSPI